MGCISKGFSLLLVVLLVASSVIIVKPACAQASKPSVPEFTVYVIDHSYDAPATYSIDKYTGETITHSGYHVNNETIILKIRNQVFTESFNGTNYFLCYNVRVKGHFDNETGWAGYFHGHDTYFGYPHQSTSESTILSLQEEYPAHAQIDIQVEAILAHVGKVRVYEHLMDFVGTLEDGEIIDQTSGWSNTQTITIPASEPTATPNTSASPSQNPTATPQQPGSQSGGLLGLGWAEVITIALLAVITALFAVAVVYLRKRSVKPTV
jgi:hypothetical protein